MKIRRFNEGKELKQDIEAIEDILSLNDISANMNKYYKVNGVKTKRPFFTSSQVWWDIKINEYNGKDIEGVIDWHQSVADVLTRFKSNYDIDFDVNTSNHYKINIMGGEIDSKYPPECLNSIVKELKGKMVDTGSEWQAEAIMLFKREDIESISHRIPVIHDGEEIVFGIIEEYTDNYYRLHLREKARYTPLSSADHILMKSLLQ